MTEVLKLNALVPLDACQSSSSLSTERYVIEEDLLEECRNEEGRSCAFCGAKASPLWRKGPSGKGCLCHSCSSTWNNRQRAVAQAKAKNEYKKVMGVGGGAAKKENSTSSSPDANDEEDQRDDGKERENYYCRYCDNTWPLNYFRNRQQFGAHCSNCSRKRKPRDEPNTDTRQKKAKKVHRPALSPKSGNSSYDEDDYPLPEIKNEESPIEHISVTSHSAPSSSTSFERGLMERLLNVVENKLVEVNELEMIRKELQLMKSELMRRENKRQLRLEEVKNRIVNGMNELRNKMTEELSHKEEESKKDLEDMKDQIMVEFLLKERDIKTMIDTMSGNVVHDTHNPPERNAAIQKHLQEMRSSLERKLEQVRTKMGMEVGEMEKVVASGIMKCEDTIHDQLSELSAELNYQLEEVRIRFLTLEKVIKDDPRI